MTTWTCPPEGVQRGALRGRAAGGGWAEIPAIPRPSGVATPDSAPPPGSGAPLRRGVAPRATRARETCARDFTTSPGRWRHGN